MYSSSSYSPLKFESKENKLQKSPSSSVQKRPQERKSAYIEQE